MASGTGFHAGLARAAMALLAGAHGFGCSSGSQAGHGGDTHWLAACGAGAECQSGSCIRGVCTEYCSDGRGCSGRSPAACYSLDSPGLAGLPGEFGPDRPADGICLATCIASTDCSTGQRCHLGACLTDPSRLTAADAGRTVPHDDAGPSETHTSDPLSMDAFEQTPAQPTAPASDFSALSPEIAFDRPIRPPVPERGFVGTGLEHLLGTWGCPPGATRCIRLEITRDEAGRIVGEWVADATDPSSLLELGPVMDPNAPYPPGLSEEQLVTLLHQPLTPGLRLPVFDARFDGTRLRFWTSHAHIWRQWCELQTPHAVPDGQPSYQCVDPEAPPGSIDNRVMALCTSELSAGICQEEDYPVPCNCTGLLRLACSPAVCLCDQDGCSTDYHALQLVYEFEVSEDSMMLVAGQQLGSIWILPRQEVSP